MADETRVREEVKEGRSVQHAQPGRCSLDLETGTEDSRDVVPAGEAHGSIVPVSKTRTGLKVILRQVLLASLPPKNPEPSHHALVLAEAPTTDPNWLLSTAAQSGAALVAIVGGFLVSRLVTLSAEREGIKRRLREVRETRALTETHLDAVSAERDRVYRKWFREHHLDDVLTALGAVEPATLLAWMPRGSTQEQMELEAEALVMEVREAAEAITTMYDSAKSPPDEVSLLRADGLVVPEHLEAIYEGVARIIAKQRRPRSSWGMGYEGLVLPSLVPRSDLAYQRPDTNVQREQQLRGEVELLASDETRLVEALSSVERPRFLRLGLGSFIYFALVGVLVPVVLMSLRPVPDALAARLVVALLFGSGLLSVVVYLVVALRDLLGPPRLSSDDES